MLKITGKTEGQDDAITFITEGKFSAKDNLMYIEYPETELSGLAGCTTSLTISPHKIKMKRKGMPFETIMEFEQGKRFNGMYDTPYGPIDMEVLTNSINRSFAAEDRGHLSIDYSVSLRGLTEARKILDIELTPKKN